MASLIDYVGQLPGTPPRNKKKHLLFITPTIEHDLLRNKSYNFNTHIISPPESGFSYVLFYRPPWHQFNFPYHFNQGVPIRSHLSARLWGIDMPWFFLACVIPAYRIQVGKYCQGQDLWQCGCSCSDILSFTTMEKVLSSFIPDYYHRYTCCVVHLELNLYSFLHRDGPIHSVQPR